MRRSAADDVVDAVLVGAREWRSLLPLLAQLRVDRGAAAVGAVGAVGAAAAAAAATAVTATTSIAAAAAAAASTTAAAGAASQPECACVRAGRGGNP